MLRAFVLFAVLAVPIFAEDLPPKWIDSVAARGLSQLPSRAALVADAKAAELQLRSAKSARIVRNGQDLASVMTQPAVWHRHIQFGSKESKQVAIEEATKLAAIREEAVRNATVNQPPELNPEQIMIGHAGTVWRDELRIVQVIDHGNAIVTMTRAVPTTLAERGVPKTRYRGVPIELWLQRDTTGWTDGATVPFKEPIVLTGTRQYETVGGGSKTLFTAREWTQEELERFRNWKPAGAKK